MAKTGVDGFSDAVGKILAEYGEEIADKMDEVVPKVARAGVKALKQNSGVFSGRKYAGSWSSKIEKGRLQTTATLYSIMPGLPHLLEFGHANRGGGRTAGRVHIAPIEKQIIDDFEKEVEKAIK